MAFRNGNREIARYAGMFAGGVREGHGIATSDKGLVWTGAWRGDEACGHGLLEAPDGARCEGEVAPDESGAPPRKAETHRVVTHAPPPPPTAGG